MQPLRFGCSTSLKALHAFVRSEGKAPQRSQHKVNRSLHGAVLTCHSRYAIRRPGRARQTCSSWRLWWIVLVGRLYIERIALASGGRAVRSLTIGKRAGVLPMSRLVWRRWHVVRMSQVIRRFVQCADLIGDAVDARYDRTGQGKSDAEADTGSAEIDLAEPVLHRIDPAWIDFREIEKLQPQQGGPAYDQKPPQNDQVASRLVFGVAS